MPSAVSRWLVVLSDPQQARNLPPRAMSIDSLRRLLDLAGRHGVLPAVLRNLRRLTRCDDPARVLAARDRQAAQALLLAAEESLRASIGFCLLLRLQLQKVSIAMAQAGIPMIVLKGPDFADRLYAPSMRLFTDLDLLVSADAMDAAAGELLSLGYRETHAPMKYADGYGERTFAPPQPGGSVELHWNLVNSPTVRRGVSVRLDDLQLQDHPQGTPPQAATPASQLLIACVHAAASHSFDRLGPLWDIVQIVRASEPLDEDYLRQAVRATGAGLAVATALDLADRTLHERRCAELMARLGLRGRWPVRLAITPGVVLRQHAWADSFRRQIFRAMLKKAKPRASRAGARVPLPSCGAGVSPAHPPHCQDLQARTPAPQLPSMARALLKKGPRT